MDVILYICFLVKMSLHQSIAAEAELELMKTAFDFFDENRDGKIDLKEFEVVIRAVGFNPTDELIQTTFDEFDRNQDGEIDFGEFVVMTKNFTGCSRQRLEENLREAFR